MINILSNENVDLHSLHKNNHSKYLKNEPFSHIVFDNFFNDRDLFSNVLKQSTKGYPVADIYRDDDGSTVLEFALAGFKKKELSIDIQPGKRTITISGQVDEKNPKRQRIARRNFTRTFVNYDDNLDLEEAEASFENGLLTVRVPQRPEAQPLTIEIK